MGRFVRGGCATVLVLLSAMAGAQTPLDQARTQFSQENWEEALAILQPLSLSSPSPEVSRLLGLTLYRLQDYDAALPLLEGSLQNAPDDPALLAALTEIKQAQGDSAAAVDHADRLLAVDNSPRAQLIAGLAFANAGANARAIAAFEIAWQNGSRRQRQKAALELTTLYMDMNRAEEAAQLADQAIALDPGSFDAAALRQLTTVRPAPATRDYVLSVGYWLESDDNVPLVDNANAIPGLSDTEDIRHTFYGDFLYSKKFSETGAFFGEAHFIHGVHEDLGQYDPTQFALVTGLGWTPGTWGVRIPLQATRNWTDGNTVRTNVGIGPGVFFKPSSATVLYFFAAFSEDDFDNPIRPSEDRSGNVMSLGAMLTANLGADWNLRMILTGTEYDTNGNNWQRDELRLYTYFTWRFSPRWITGIGFDYLDADFNNLNDVFLLDRDDETWAGFLNIAFQLTPRWALRGQVSGGSRDSTIKVFEYDRTVFSIGVSWTY
jgi:tetratricopeptide (TPR) repeat protein